MKVPQSTPHTSEFTCLRCNRPVNFTVVGGTTITAQELEAIIKTAQKIIEQAHNSSEREKNYSFETKEGFRVTIHVEFYSENGVILHRSTEAHSLHSIDTNLQSSEKVVGYNVIKNPDFKPDGSYKLYNPSQTTHIAVSGQGQGSIGGSLTVSQGAGVSSVGGSNLGNGVVAGGQTYVVGGPGYVALGLPHGTSIQGQNYSYNDSSLGTSVGVLTGRTQTIPTVISTQTIGQVQQVVSPQIQVIKSSTTQFQPNPNGPFKRPSTIQPNNSVHVIHQSPPIQYNPSLIIPYTRTVTQQVVPVHTTYVAPTYVAPTVPHLVQPLIPRPDVIFKDPLPSHGSRRERLSGSMTVIVEPKRNPNTQTTTTNSTSTNTVINTSTNEMLKYNTYLEELKDLKRKMEADLEKESTLKIQLAKQESELQMLKNQANFEREKNQIEKERMIQKQKELENLLLTKQTPVPNQPVAPAQDSLELQKAIAALEETRRRLEYDEKLKIDKMDQIIAERQREAQNLKQQAERNLEEQKQFIMMLRQKEQSDFESRKRENETLLSKINEHQNQYQVLSNMIRDLQLKPPAPAPQPQITVVPTPQPQNQPQQPQINYAEDFRHISSELMNMRGEIERVKFERKSVQTQNSENKQTAFQYPPVILPPPPSPQKQEIHHHHHKQNQQAPIDTSKFEKAIFDLAEQVKQLSFQTVSEKSIKTTPPPAPAPQPQIQYQVVPYPVQYPQTPVYIPQQPPAPVYPPQQPPAPVYPPQQPPAPVYPPQQPPAPVYPPQQPPAPVYPIQPNPIHHGKTSQRRSRTNSLGRQRRSNRNQHDHSFQNGHHTHHIEHNHPIEYRTVEIHEKTLEPKVFVVNHGEPTVTYSNVVPKVQTVHDPVKIIKYSTQNQTQTVTVPPSSTYTTQTTYSQTRGNPVPYTEHIDLGPRAGKKSYIKVDEYSVNKPVETRTYDVVKSELGGKKYETYNAFSSGTNLTGSITNDRLKVVAGGDASQFKSLTQV